MFEVRVYDRSGWRMETPALSVYTSFAQAVSEARRAATGAVVALAHVVRVDPSGETLEYTARNGGY